MNLEAGQVFGRYTIECVLGEGGMGRVYRAADTKLLRRVALKVLSPKDSEDPEEVDGVAFIAMEYVKGEPLRSYVGDDGVSLEQRVAWLAAIARALAAAHDGELVHRDVKPENVLVRDDGKIKVLDFGIAHHRTLGSLRAIATTSSSLLTGAPETRISGTPAYMAPEQLRGEAVDARVDQFAWGLVAWELLTGRHPNPATNLAALIADRLAKPVPPPRTLVPTIPEHVEAVVVRALALDPHERFASMDELLTALVPEARPSAPRSAPRSTSTLESAPTESASAVVVPTPRRARRRFFVVATAAIVTAAAFALVVRSRSSAPSIAVTDLPAPASANLDAIAEYRAGLQSARDGAGSEARVHFLRAAEIDPTMASANVWVAALSAFQNRAQARAALDKAKQQRASLGDRDARLLAILEPLLDRDPADLAESERRAVEATRVLPNDAHLRLQLAIVRAAGGDAAAIADADAALALDPRYVAAHLVRALALESTGRDGDALETYRRCVGDQPASASCFAGELKLLSRRGECARVGEEARRWTTSHPSDPEAFRQRAIYLSASPEARENVGELLATSRGLLPAATKARRELTDRLGVALLAGDLATAKTAADALAAKATDVAEHGEAALALLEIHDELGRPEEAGRIAVEFLRRRELWAGAARIDQDPTPIFAARARSAKLLSTEEADRAREEWIARWATRGRSGERWLIGWAAGADTPDEAKRALAALPQFEPLPELPDQRLAAGLGRTRLLAGENDAAIGALERAAQDCSVLRAPIVHARVLLWLGDALSAKGERARACEAHRRVQTMWPRRASDAPLTLTRARAALARNGC